MYISPAYAQDSGGGGGDIFGMLLPLIAMVAIFYFLVLRPQQKRVKQHAATVSGIRRGDTIVTNGGLVGKVHKVSDDREIVVDIAENVRVKIVRDMISQVRVKGEPAGDDDPKK